MSEVERLLQGALAPVEPPGRLSDRLERRLTELTDIAAEELAEWELTAMRDPRNWARPVGAVAVGVVAAAALVVVRANQGRRRRDEGPLRTLESSAREAGGLLRRRLER